MNLQKIAQLGRQAAAEKAGSLSPFAQRGQTDLMLLNQLGQGFAPVVTAPPQRRTDIMGLLMDQFVVPRVKKMMGTQGLVPGGLSSQNILDYQEKHAGNPYAQGNVNDTSFQSTAGLPPDPRTLNRPTMELTGPIATADPSNLPTITPHPSGGGHTSKPSWGSAASSAASAMPFNRFGNNPLTVANKVYGAAKKGPKAMISYMSDKSPVGLPAMNEFIGRTIHNKAGRPGGEYQPPATSAWGLLKQLTPHHERLRREWKHHPDNINNPVYHAG